ncbi:MAG TPA: cyclophilin-like fold protein [Anaeromyxobacter sp.]|nr:cyclophilin-like fold protein [Anaeromyxobacter sp.]
MKIHIKVEDRTLTATLADSEAARDFAALLPLTLTLTDYHSTEKIAELPKKLSTEGAPAGVDPEVGDIAYYAPWRNLAIYYRDFGYSSGLVKLAHLDSGVEALSKSGPVRVTIERAEQ